MCKNTSSPGAKIVMKINTEWVYQKQELAKASPVLPQPHAFYNGSPQVVAGGWAYDKKAKLYSTYTTKKNSVRV